MWSIVQCLVMLTQDCLLSFSYPVSYDSEDGSNWTLEDAATKALRTVMILPYSKLELAITALEKSVHVA